MKETDESLHSKSTQPSLKLESGSKIAVVGGGPAGSFYSYFLLDLADRLGIDIEVDIYEPKDFSRYGPKGCNHCGGILSESLVQIMATEGIVIPPNVLQRGIQSYILHTDTGTVHLDTPLQEKRIAAIYRGGGPLGTNNPSWESFDGYLQQLTKKSGANIIHEFVKDVHFDYAGYPVVTTKKDISKTYDLIVGAMGVNSSLLKHFETLDFGFKAPEITKTSISEVYLGQEQVKRYFSNSMHVYLLNIPRLTFAAIIPKGDFVTIALLGDKVDKELLNAFLNAPEVKACFPEDIELVTGRACKCFPTMNIKSAVHPYTDRLVMIGDSATAKLYKNGIGAAYITAKAAATTSILEGISSDDFQQHYWSACKKIKNDNVLGKIVFTVTEVIQKSTILKRGLLRQVEKENNDENSQRHMSTVLWDTFTGSAPYQEIFMRTLHPGFLGGFIKEIVSTIVTPESHVKEEKEKQMIEESSLGKMYKDGEEIIKQGDPGDCMYVIQSGTVEVLKKNDSDDHEVHLAELSDGEFFGEMALFEKEVRSTSVRAKGSVHVLTIDKKTLLRRIEEDPSMAFRMLEKMSSRIRDLNTKTQEPNVTEFGCPVNLEE